MTNGKITELQPGLQGRGQTLLNGFLKNSFDNIRALIGWILTNN